MNVSIAGAPDAETAQVEVRAAQHDETADTFFPVFSRSADAGVEPGVIVTADAQALRGHGRLETSVEHASGVLYKGRLNYRVATEVKLETMRRIVTDAGPVLRVTTVQPPTGRDAGHRVRVRVLNPAGDQVREVVEEITGKRMTISVGLADVTPGDYHALVELIDAEGLTVNVDKPRPFTVWPESPPWHATTLGLSDDVPPPWTPMGVESGEDGMIEVSCWNRGYRFGPGSVLPVAIRSGQAPSARRIQDVRGHSILGSSVSYKVWL